MTCTIYILAPLKKLSMDEQKRLEYEARQKAIRDYNSQMKSAREYGLKKGMEEGIEQGIEQGIKLNYTKRSAEAYQEKEGEGDEPCDDRGAS